MPAPVVWWVARWPRPRVWFQPHRRWFGRRDVAPLAPEPIAPEELGLAEAADEPAYGWEREPDDEAVLGESEPEPEELEAWPEPAPRFESEDEAERDDEPLPLPDVAASFERSRLRSRRRRR